MEVLDAYLQHETFAALEQGIAPSPLSIEEWNAFIILRHLGLRSSDIRHLIAIGPDRALQRDADGDPIVYVSHRNNKTKIDLRIPIPHLNGLGGDKNPVLSAIERQIPIAVNRGKSPDGRIYLFNRCISRGRDAQSVEPITSDQLSKSAKKVSAFLNLGSADGPSTLLPIIFRHTCLTELAEAGVQIEKIAKFAGHAKIGSTEFYYGLGQPWRKPLPPLPSTVRLDSALDDAIKASDKKPTPLEYLIQIELSDSVCESVITGKSCIAMRCLACPYKELTPAHLPLIERVVNEYERHVSQAKSFGLSEKVKEFSAILQFNRLALQFLLQGKNFRGERDIPNFHEKEQS
ncbi:tyrosine-type recombinase/integrase [Paraburkholderia bannensis]|uniref:tyrosine-type recombinase/integrase n=1 Tax=Paraburkholderia bannensis TaxID=765414 RepID=UPI002AB183F2|nr:tyrosine-type recombinase/integrase [Paraburkholderia bannensis]